MTAVIILNWNGYKDTIECLESLYQVTSDFYTIVVDNGSTDSSIPNIKDFLDTRGIASSVVNYGSTMVETPAARSCIIYNVGENLGFARGNNEAIRLIAKFEPEHFLLLNNDTIVEHDFLDNLDVFAKDHKDIEAMTPLICYNAERNRIWNCGGRQFMGFRKYYYAGKTVDTVKEDFIKISFMTGCALFFSPSLLNADGGLLTENFFFGEEDFNFCLRMNREKRKMACVLTSKIYHKVSNSLKVHSNIGKIYIYYLNRFIDVRLNMSSTGYMLWAWMYTFYVMALLYWKGFSLVDAYEFQKKLRHRAKNKDTVTQSDFIKAVSCDNIQQI